MSLNQCAFRRKAKSPVRFIWLFGTAEASPSIDRPDASGGAGATQQLEWFSAYYLAIVDEELRRALVGAANYWQQPRQLLARDQA
jgi:hypothetical protein